MQYPWPLPQAQDSAAAVIQADGPNKKTAPVLKPEVAGKRGKCCRGELMLEGEDGRTSMERKPSASQ